MKNHILTYNQLNESNEFDNLSFEETGRLIELGLIDDQFLIKIYNYVKDGSHGNLYSWNGALTCLPNWLTKVDGSLSISDSEIEDIPDTLKITKHINASRSKLKEFRRSKTFGNLNIDFTQITKLSDGLMVDGFLSVFGIQFEEIPKNLTIRGNFYIEGSNLEQFTDEELHKMYRITGEIIRG